MELNKKEPFDRFVDENIEILGPILEKIEIPLKEKKHTLSIPSKLRATYQFSPSKVAPILYAKHRAEKQGLDVDAEVKRAEEALEKEKTYAKKVSVAPSRIKLTTKDFTQDQLISFDQAKVIFWHDYLSKSVKKSKKNPLGRFDVDDNNTFEVAQLLKYFIQDPTCVYDLDKGICIHGPVGSGKTHILKQLALFVKDAGFYNSFSVVSMKDVNLEVSQNLDTINKYTTGNFCFDEVVAKEVNCYGTKVVPADEIIQGQYKRFVLGYGKKMHLTSNVNLNPTDPVEAKILKQMYDIRSLDRLRQMCNFIYLGGPSRRK